MLSRLSMNMNIFVESVLVYSMAIMNAYNYGMRILGYMDKQ